MERRNFIRITGTGAVIIGSGGFFTSCKALGEEELKVWAFAAFNRFVEVWNFNDFWKRDQNVIIIESHFLWIRK